MNQNQIIIVVLIALLVVGGWFWYAQSQDIPVDADLNSASENVEDAGEGPGSVKQDVRIIVGESIVGKWQSVDDAKFVREFQDGGKIADWYDGEIVTSGTFTVFTKETAPTGIEFPLMSDRVYIQIMAAGSQDEKLTFSVDKLTPEMLEMTYMERGGVLRFTAIQ